MTIIIIPARIGSTRLPRKMLIDIGGEPLIVQTWREAVRTNLRVVVATDSHEISDAIESRGGETVMTSPHRYSGTDRVWEAVCRLNIPSEESIINIQGDMPVYNHRDVLACARLLGDAEMGTLIERCDDIDTLLNPSKVKVVVSGDQISAVPVRALMFTRAPAPWGPGRHYVHVGVYAYSHAVLKYITGLGRTALEIREGLEQLRALEGGVRIDAVRVTAPTWSIDTAADLETLKNLFLHR